jgi:hypothetical protein
MENMTTYEVCRWIRKAIVNRAAQVMAYASWSDEFATQEIRDFPKNVRDNETDKLGEGEVFQSAFGIQPSDLTDDEMLELGFGKWEEGNPIRLIPLYLFPFLADEMEIEDINGEKSIMKKSDMDNDQRFGCLAYGVIPKDKRQSS